MHRSRLLLLVRLAALATACAISALGLVLTAAIIDAGPRNVTRESVDEGAIACGRVGEYGSAVEDYDTQPPDCGRETSAYAD